MKSQLGPQSGRGSKAIRDALWTIDECRIGKVGGFVRLKEAHLNLHIA